MILLNLFTLLQFICTIIMFDDSICGEKLPMMLYRQFHQSKSRGEKIEQKSLHGISTLMKYSKLSDRFGLTMQS